MNRTSLQQLCRFRIQDASVLLGANQWAGAYYLAGYALECALKSCVLAHINRTGIIFEDKKYAEKCWTHNIKELVTQADLLAERGKALSSNPVLGQNWSIAEQWSESSRYDVGISQSEAENLFSALNDPNDGVIPWVQSYW